MNCPLYEHFVQNKKLAVARQEHAEIIRVNSEMEAHRKTCAVCNGIEIRSLAELLFDAPIKGEL